MGESIFKLLQFTKRDPGEDSFEGDLDQEDFGVSENFYVKSMEPAPIKHQDKTAALEFYKRGEKMEIQSTDDLAKDLIKNPTSVRDKARNKNILSEIAYQNALNDVALKKFPSIRKAAEKHSVDFSPLAKIIRTGKFFQGKGKRSPYFTDEEEKIVVSRALEMIDGGKIFSTMNFRNIIEEEIEVIKVNFPERVSNFEKLRGTTNKFSAYCNYLAQRNDHQKNIHYSFMN